MICDRCKKSGSVLKDMWNAEGTKLSICVDCRKALDNGAGFTLPKGRPHLSRMAKQMRRLDDGSTDTGAALQGAMNLLFAPSEADKKRIVDSPFPAAWRKKS